MSTPRKQEVITFKVDAALSDALARIPNRSEFIREAILAALKNACPLCCGTGVLTPDQRRHWEVFAQTHQFEECHDCHTIHLVCAMHDHAVQDEPNNPSGEGHAE